jgi:hypothetical protein
MALYPGSTMPTTDKPQTHKCRLTLSIDGQDYRLSPTRGDLGSGVVLAWRLHKMGTSTRHDTAETLDGPTCSCGDQTWRHEGKDSIGCKHVRALKALGLLC